MRPHTSSPPRPAPISSGKSAPPTLASAFTSVATACSAAAAGLSTASAASRPVPAGPTPNRLTRSATPTAQYGWPPRKRCARRREGAVIAVNGRWNAWATSGEDTRRVESGSEGRKAVSEGDMAAETSSGFTVCVKVGDAWTKPCDDGGEGLIRGDCPVEG